MVPRPINPIFFIRVILDFCLQLATSRFGWYQSVADFTNWLMKYRPVCPTPKMYFRFIPDSKMKYLNITRLRQQGIEDDDETVRDFSANP
jgi:hypothetical protein